MLKKLTAISLGAMLLLDSTGSLSYAVLADKTTAQSASILAEQNKKDQKKRSNDERIGMFFSEEQKNLILEKENQKLESEANRLRQELKDKEINDLLQRLQSENTALKQEIVNCKKKAKKKSSLLSSIVSYFKTFTGVTVGWVSAIVLMLLVCIPVVGLLVLGIAGLECHMDKTCKSFRDKMGLASFKEAFQLIFGILNSLKIHILVSPQDEEG